MPRAINDKCFRCAYLDTRQAQQQSCYDPAKCRRRRSDYRRRNERAGIVPAEGAVQDLVVEPKRTVYAIVYFYRETKSAPIHAIKAELYDGQTLTFQTKPIHALGLTPAQIEDYMKQVLLVFSQQCGLNVPGYKAAIELHPVMCPLKPCPLKDS